MVSIREESVPARNVWLPAGLAMGVAFGLIALIPAFVIGSFAWALPVLGLAAGLALAAHWSSRSTERVLSRISPLAVDPAHLDATAMARLENLVDGLCLAIGVAEPALLVVEDDHPNAMAVARSGDQYLVVTSALIGGLERIELEGVLAELLVRLRSGDAELATKLASVYTLPFVDTGLDALGRPLVRWALSRHLDEFRDITADQQAVAVTRYPPGLSSAFERIAGTAGVPGAIGPGLDHLWMIPPDRAGELLAIAPLDWRIDVLLEI